MVDDEVVLSVEGGLFTVKSEFWGSYVPDVEEDVYDEFVVLCVEELPVELLLLVVDDCWVVLSDDAVCDEVFVPEEALEVEVFC